MIYSALDIARYIVSRSIKRNSLITNQHLQKSLYFLQGRSLQLSDEPLFSDKIEMWRLGPIVVAVYDEYKGFGSQLITNIGEDIIFNKETWEVDKIAFNDKHIDIQTRNFLNPLIDSLLVKKGLFLIDKTMEHDLWQKKKEEILKSNDVRGSFFYKNEELKKFFRQPKIIREIHKEIFIIN